MWGREVDRHNADKGQAGGSMVPVQFLGCMPSSFKHFNSTQIDLLKMQQSNIEMQDRHTDKLEGDEKVQHIKVLRE